MPTLHFAQATTGDLIGNLLHVSDGHALVSPRLYSTRSVVCVGNSNERPSDGEEVGSPLSRGEDGFLLLRIFQLESEVLVQLTDWGSIANPASTGDFLSPTWYVAPRSVSTAPVASLWSEDILVPTSGERGDGDGAVPLDGKDISPSVPCYCR